MISGCIVLRDALRQGLPFIEAALAALPACDELILSDGGSTDGTWKLLQQLADAHKGRIRLFHQTWRGKGDHVLAAALDEALAKGRHPYCLVLGPDEVLHEATAAAIRELPGRHPADELFALPVLETYGGRFAGGTESRRRLLRYQRSIRARSGGAECGYVPLRLFMQSPKLFWRRVVKGDDARVIPLDPPIHRARAIFPKAWIERLENHAVLARGTPEAARIERELAAARKAWNATWPDGTPRDFWQLLGAALDLSVIADPPAHLVPLGDRWEYQAVM